VLRRPSQRNKTARWIALSPQAGRGEYTSRYVPAFSRRDCARVLHDLLPKEGRRKRRVPAAPAASRAK
jgi:hypothetical protein